jgi:hypothetical protein
MLAELAGGRGFGPVVEIRSLAVFWGFGVRRTRKPILRIVFEGLGLFVQEFVPGVFLFLCGLFGLEDVGGFMPLSRLVIAGADQLDFVGTSASFVAFGS